MRACLLAAETSPGSADREQLQVHHVTHRMGKSSLGVGGQQFASLGVCGYQLGNFGGGGQQLWADKLLLCSGLQY